MKLYTRCSKCREEINFSAWVSVRFAQAKKLNEKIELRCTNCNTSNKYHVNDIRAEKNKIVALVASLILLAGTAGMVMLVWDYIFRIADVYATSAFVGVIGIPMAVYQAIVSGQERKVWLFNSYKY
ncbi:MAG: hypothetical protein RLP12_17520 [Ekhidna sp.]